MEDARPALDALARFDPALLDATAARDVWARWLWNEDLIERLVEGLEKGGVARPPKNVTDERLSVTLWRRLLQRTSYRAANRASARPRPTRPDPS